MAVTEQGAKRIRAILQKEKLSRADVDELRALGNLGGQLPAADGTDEHGEYWNRQTFQQWAQRNALQHQSQPIL